MTRRFVTAAGHTCHADGCATQVPPRLFMCPRHWRMVPADMQAELWWVYVPGQENRKDPTQAYIDVARRIIAHVRSVDPPKPVQHRLL